MKKIVLPQAPMQLNPQWVRTFLSTLQRGLDSLVRGQEELAQALPAGVVVRYTGTQAPVGWKFCGEDGGEPADPPTHIIKVQS